MPVRFGSNIRLFTAGLTVMMVAATIATLANFVWALLTFAGLDVTVSIYGATLFEDIVQLGRQSQLAYHSLNIARCLVYFLALLLLRRVVRSMIGNFLAYRKNAVRVVVIALCLSLAEVMSGVVTIYILDAEFSASKFAAYAGIMCLFLTAYVLLKASEVRRYYDSAV